jgi:hypothetical protein
VLPLLLFVDPAILLVAGDVAEQQVPSDAAPRRSLEPHSAAARPEPLDVRVRRDQPVEGGIGRQHVRIGEQRRRLREVAGRIRDDGRRRRFLRERTIRDERGAGGCADGLQHLAA